MDIADECVAFYFCRVINFCKKKSVDVQKYLENGKIEKFFREFEKIRGI